MFLLIVQMIRVYYIFLIQGQDGLINELIPIIENATGQGINLYNYQKLLNPINEWYILV